MSDNDKGARMHAMRKKQGRPPKKYPHMMHSHGELFRLDSDKANGTPTIRAIGTFRDVNGVMIGQIKPDWRLLEAHARAAIANEQRQLIEDILLTFAQERAGEIGAMPWTDRDKGLIDCAQDIDIAAKALLAAIDKAAPATTYILERMEQMQGRRFDGTSFSRDEFYPHLAQLVSRSHLLLQELVAEKKQGVRLRIGDAWRRFVTGIAGIYREITGAELTTPELSNRNADTSKPSPFLTFAHTAMLQVPEELRVYTTGSGENGIYSFSSKLSETVSELGLR
ncbi:hypothetical protein LG047_15830 [Methylocystis sp. WRRC1]|uniref:hypothetical protein n=1 Tax=Methylocystis sp. WRRC1 TaxID=1732014 RepID=UPI001D13D652|nr:hypothetical protein [Methylocystis sp. WRRC1]MCC3246769.1 hypothetical protein [Methylocystis sp. WRRC1]